MLACTSIGHFEAHLHHVFSCPFTPSGALLKGNLMATLLLATFLLFSFLKFVAQRLNTLDNNEFSSNCQEHFHIIF